MNETVQEVVGVLAALLDINPDSISEEDQLYDGLGLDSTKIIDLLLQLEITCGIEFDMEELEPEDLETVKSLSACIDAHKRAT
ncbi:acyl carrier protein [Brevibacillus humidisoli]|uniref:acyl carrier protein n=1 Tax=Brevibacillus humidisoli TaxID=2895522 RepID=UPI001E4E62DC|nr:acyl carrier protein [Brevibacillus humidisoli]UFJ42424.1 acyl carrier protein [Brevibacillus humidisoli]